ncbi:MAG: uroporphyrinogen decarboxylase [Acidobacteria bacterium]|nr:uroporphyrinogen decarboxylase [Acidobacteriota bacterium]
MYIESADAAYYRVPLPAPVSDATHGAMTDFELVVCRLRDDKGLEGLGYTYTVGRGGTAVHAMVRDDLAPALLGSDCSDIEAVWEAMQHRLHWVGRGGAASFAIAAVDVALWDLAARRAEQPLWRFLGGKDPRVDVYAGGIDLDLPLEELLEQARQTLDAGFRAIKMKVGRERLAEDVERIRAMRELLGEGFPLMVDANMAWELDEAIRRSQAFAEFDLVWLEEPLDPGDFEGHAELVCEDGPAIATGENLHSVEEFSRLLGFGAADYPQPDLATMGGVTAWRQVQRMAYDYKRPVTTHGVHDLHVHLLAASPNASYLEWHGFGLERFLLDGPLTIEDGQAVAPERPGHGVRLDWAKLEALGA